jgi:hypothetical protein
VKLLRSKAVMRNSNETYGQGFQKVILIILFLFLTVAVFIIWNEPSVGFEPSIYNSTPYVLWIALISSVVGGVSIVILSVSNSDLGRSSLWKYGLLLVLLCYTIGLSLFIIRGYHMWAIAGDPGAHLGWINEILQNGFIPSVLFYPITHIFLSEMSLITTLDPQSLYTIIPLFFSLLCVIFVYMFVRVLSTNKIEPVIAVIISCTFLYGWYLNFTPNALSNMFFPLALFLMFKYLKSKNISWGILLYIILLVYPVFHPLPSIILGLFLLTLWIPHKLHDLKDIFYDKKQNILNVNRMNIKGGISFLFLLVWFIFWYSFYSIWGYTITEVYQTIRAEGSTSQGRILTENINNAQFYGYNIVEIFLKSYGDLLLLSILSVLAFLLLWKTVSKEQKLENIFSLYGPFGVLCIVIPVLFFFNLPFGPFRFLFYVSVLETVFVAYLVSFILVRSRESKRNYIVLLTNVLTIVLLVSLFLNGILGLYPSSPGLLMTEQTTQSEILGMKHFFEYRNVTIPVIGLNTAVGRFADLLLSKQKRSVQQLPAYLPNKDLPPWHFGYEKFPSVASSYGKETNLIVMQRDKSYYSDYLPAMAKYRFTLRDYEQLYNDPGASLIYSNGGFDLLTIVPQQFDVRR